MAHHLVFISRDNLQGVKAEEQLAAVGLADHAQGALTVPTDGPDGSGTLYGWVPNKLHYNTNEQEWFPAVPSGDLPGKRYWVGVWKDSPVKELDLRRPGVLHGNDIELGNGERWHIPVPSFLPHDMMLADDGTLRYEPQRRYQEVCLEAVRWRNMLRGAQIAVEYEELWRFCILCLNLNYRLPQELVSHLRLVNTENVKQVLYATFPGEGM